MLFQIPTKFCWLSGDWLPVECGCNFSQKCSISSKTELSAWMQENSCQCRILLFWVISCAIYMILLFSGCNIDCGRGLWHQHCHPIRRQVRQLLVCCQSDPWASREVRITTTEHTETVSAVLLLSPLMAFWEYFALWVGGWVDTQCLYHCVP